MMRKRRGLGGPELTDDGTNLSGRSGNTVGGRPIPRGEALARDDEGGRVRTEVEEELSQDVHSQQAVLTKLVIGETHDDEQDSEDREAHELDGLAADGVNGSNGHPVARDGTRQDDDKIANRSIVQIFVCGLRACGRIANGGKDS